MAPSTFKTVSLEPALSESLESLAKSRHRSVQWLMREAIKRYVEAEQGAGRHDQGAHEAWEEYRRTGEYVAGNYVLAWLESVGTGKELARPSTKIQQHSLAGRRRRGSAKTRQP